MHNATVRGGCNAKRCNATCRPRWITLSNKLALSLAVYIDKYIYLLLYNLTLYFNFYIYKSLNIKLSYTIIIIKLVTISQATSQKIKGIVLVWCKRNTTHSLTNTHKPAHPQPHTLFLLSCLLRSYVSYLSCEKGLQAFSHTHRTHFQSHTHSDTSSIASDTHSHTHAFLILQKVFPWGWRALLLELPRSRKIYYNLQVREKNIPQCNNSTISVCVCVVYYMDRTPGATVTRMSACVPRKAS